MPVSGEKWDHAQRLFAAAADLSSAECRTYLDHACGGDADLRAEVDSLLRADHGSETYLSSLIQDEAARVVQSQRPGDRIGSYRILRELGRGGMGAVFLATRDDDQYQKQVALKVVKRGMDTDEVLSRFRHERQILAELDHPYIARLHDGGTTPDGLPFFVMEYVEGLTLDEYCRKNAMPRKDRLRLFLRICEAVAYAHRNLVVHRDLKPANILVTSDGIPKLLDFGVAKLLSGSAPYATVAATRLLTPDYASPEQVRGLAVSTSTDIYSLGAILFQLLTERTAHRVTGISTMELERAVCEEEVPRPSQIERDIDSDLDNIVLMSMRKEPEARYPSANHLAGDIERYLKGEPVSARQSSALYRLRKFVARNRWQVVATGVVAASLIAATAISTVLFRRAELERQIAVEAQLRSEKESKEALEARRAEQHERELADRQRDEANRQRLKAEHRVTELVALANAALFDVHSTIESLPGAVTAREMIVRTTLQYLETLERDAKEDPQVRVALASAYYKVGMVQGDLYTSSLQDYAGALKSFLHARELLQPIYRAHPNDPATLLVWLEIEDSIADQNYHDGKARDAAATYVSLLPLARRLGSMRPGDLAYVKQEAFLYGRLAVVLHADDPARALEYANGQMDMIRKLIVRFPQDNGLKHDFGVGLSTAAGTLAAAGELERAAEFYQKAIDIREEVVRIDPNNFQLRRGLIVNYGNYAGLLGVPWSANLERPAEARAAASRAVELARGLVASDSRDGSSRVDLAMSLLRLGSIEPVSVEASLATLREAISILDPVVRANPKSVGPALNLATAREYAGRRLAAMGRSAEAQSEYEASLALIAPFVGAGAVSVVAQEIADDQALAILYASKGDNNRAFQFAQRAISAAERRLHEQASDAIQGRLAESYWVLASVHSQFSEREQARTAAQKALDCWSGVHNRGILSMYRKPMRDAAQLAAK